MFVDAHVHVDRYPRPPEILAAAAAARVVCVAVTESPKEYELLVLRAGKRRNLRIALGAHPMRSAPLNTQALERFTALLPAVDYVGEVGLDGSREGRPSLVSQRRVFEHVLACPGISRRLLTVHSRGAEEETVAALEQARVTAVLHWYTGPLKHADRALDAGMFFSVNAAMLRSQKGTRLLRSLPRERVLTETDGPYVRRGARPVVPADVPSLVADVAGAWACDPEEARAQIWENMATAFQRASSGDGRSSRIIELRVADCDLRGDAAVGSRSETRHEACSEANRACPRTCGPLAGGSLLRCRAGVPRQAL